MSKTNDSFNELGTDASAWADAFLKCPQPADRATVHRWFAAAIVAGHDEAQAEPPPRQAFHAPTCRGSLALGTACGHCERCALERGEMDSELRYQVKQRMDYIAATLSTKGRINRQDLIQRFRISVPQASLDLSQFQRLYPNAMTYCLSKKAYLKNGG